MRGAGSLLYYDLIIVERLRLVLSALAVKLTIMVYTVKLYFLCVKIPVSSKRYSIQVNTDPSRPL